MANSIQDRLIQLTPYNPGFNLYSGQIIIHVSYKPNWRVLESYDDKVKIASDDNNQFTYHYYASADIDFNRIFDVIDTTVKFNSEAELKRQLLIQKVNELKILFETEDLQTLQTLEFKIKKKKTKKVLISSTNDENNNISETIVNTEIVSEEK